MMVSIGVGGGWGVGGLLHLVRHEDVVKQSESSDRPPSVVRALHIDYRCMLVEQPLNLTLEAKVLYTGSR